MQSIAVAEGSKGSEAFARVEGSSLESGGPSFRSRETFLGTISEMLWFPPPLPSPHLSINLSGSHFHNFLQSA